MNMIALVGEVRAGRLAWRAEGAGGTFTPAQGKGCD
jgi:hypothetical protein